MGAQRRGRTQDHLLDGRAVLMKADKIATNVPIVRDPEVPNGAAYLVDAGRAMERAVYWRDKAMEHLEQENLGAALDCIRISKQYRRS